MVHICRICCYIYSIMNRWYIKYILSNCDRSYIDGKIQFYLTALWCIYLDLLVFVRTFREYAIVNMMFAWSCWMHYDDVITSAMAFQITSLTNVYSSANSRPDQWKHHGSARVTGRCEGYSAVTSAFQAPKKNVSIWWRGHVLIQTNNKIDATWECDSKLCPAVSFIDFATTYI